MNEHQTSLARGLVKVEVVRITADANWHKKLDNLDGLPLTALRSIKWVTKNVRLETFS